MDMRKIVQIARERMNKIRVICFNCGRTIDTDVLYSSDNSFEVRIRPCPDCIKEAKEEGYDEGIMAGLPPT